MTFQTNGEGAVTDRFDEIEATLLRYPDIDNAELADLKRWFDKWPVWPARTLSGGNTVNSVLRISTSSGGWRWR